VVVSVVVGLLFVVAAPSLAVPTVSYQCSPAPTDCTGWYRSDVALEWTVEPPKSASVGCEDVTFTSDTAGTAESCTAKDKHGEVTARVTVRRDATPPQVGPGQARGADVDRWYNRPFTVAFSGQDSTSGLAGPCARVTYAGPDTAARSLVGTCIDRAGNVGSSPAFRFRYDATGPRVAAAVAGRAPDHAGWFTAPVTFNFIGADAMSGLSACAPARYAGPDGASANVVGWCRDYAGNRSRRSFGLLFDATPPRVSGLRAIARDRRVVVRWRRIRDAASIEVRRVPGVGLEPTSLVFSGRASRFVDHNVRNGVAYRYEVRPADAAGNTGSAAVTATPKRRRTAPRLRLPSANALIRASTPPLLRWTSVRRARYYNVQLYRKGRKVLSAWPQRPRYQVERRWRYAGEQQRLSQGRYVWYVWPGYGDRSQANYGGMVGRRAFVVVR
jgi:hypothetical protein